MPVHQALTLLARPRLTPGSKRVIQCLMHLLFTLSGLAPPSFRPSIRVHLLLCLQSLPNLERAPTWPTSSLSRLNPFWMGFVSTISSRQLCITRRSSPVCVSTQIRAKPCVLDRLGERSSTSISPPRLFLSKHIHPASNFPPPRLTLTRHAPECQSPFGRICHLGISYQQRFPKLSTVCEADLRDNAGPGCASLDPCNLCC